MSWVVEYTDEFGDWWNGLSDAEQEALDVSVRLLESRGPALGFPYCSGINGSKHGHMRELRTQQGGRPLRTLYAFDPRRSAILRGQDGGRPVVRRARRNSRPPLR